MNTDTYPQFAAHVARQGRVEWADAIAADGCLAGLSRVSLAAIVRRLLQCHIDVVLIDKSAATPKPVSVAYSI